MRNPLFCVWCRRRDLNPHKLCSPPPQDGVSTNSTTSANLFNLLGHIPVALLQSLQLGNFIICRYWRDISAFYGSGDLVFKTKVISACLLLGYIRQTQAATKEKGRKYSRGARKRIAAARTAEKRLGGAATERRAHIRTLALLQQNQADDCERRQNVKYEDQLFHSINLPLCKWRRTHWHPVTLRRLARRQYPAGQIILLRWLLLRCRRKEYVF